MKQTRKGKMWHCGMKIHVGTDKRGVVHSLTTSHAAEADVNHMPQPLHGAESEVYGDRAYWGDADRQELERLGVRYRVNRRGTRKAPVSEQWRKINRIRSRVRARGEHIVRVVKCQWGFQKVRYRGLAKNPTRGYAAFALANLYPVRKILMPQGDWTTNPPQCELHWPMNMPERGMVEINAACSGLR